MRAVSPADDDTTVRAAGCVLWRPAPATASPGSTASPGLELCLVHRPKYDDWSHPKGKLKPGEAPLAGALREVAEETGYAAEPGAELPTVRYLANGRPKEVRYWAAAAGTGAFAPLGRGRPHPVAVPGGGPHPPHPAPGPDPRGRAAGDAPSRSTRGDLSPRPPRNRPVSLT